jgi:hypothetical protein
MAIVIVLPLAQLLVEQLDLFGRAVLVQLLIELSVSDSIGSLDLAVEMWRPGPYVHVTDVLCSRCQ